MAEGSAKAKRRRAIIAFRRERGHASGDCGRGGYYFVKEVAMTMTPEQKKAVDEAGDAPVVVCVWHR
jgi:hypothetical protein